MTSISKKMHSFLTLTIVSIIILLAAIGYLIYQNFQFKKHNKIVEQEILSMRVEFASTIENLKDAILFIEQDLNLTKEKSENLRLILQKEKEKMSSIETQVGDISGTVDVLDKLSKTDPEILQKYSKVYFLSENYIPLKLTEIKTEYIHELKENLLLRGDVMPFLNNLIDTAVNAGIDIKVLSAYRSFGEQATLKSSYVMVYGAGTANQFSAEQGYSEHQLGTTVDFITSEAEAALSLFEKSPAYTWLKNNAHKYGFMISYPEDNSYYKYEPWHWRFVGRKLSEKLHNEGKYFYELDQREIDEYLAYLFD